MVDEPIYTRIALVHEGPNLNQFNEDQTVVEPSSLRGGY